MSTNTIESPYAISSHTSLKMNDLTSFRIDNLNTKTLNISSKKSIAVRQSRKTSNTDLKFIKKSQVALKSRDIYSTFHPKIEIQEKSSDSKYRTVYI